MSSAEEPPPSVAACKLSMHESARKRKYTFSHRRVSSRSMTREKTWANLSWLTPTKAMDTWRWIRSVGGTLLFIPVVSSSASSVGLIFMYHLVSGLAVLPTWTRGASSSGVPRRTCRRSPVLTLPTSFTLSTEHVMDWTRLVTTWFIPTMISLGIASTVYRTPPWSPWQVCSLPSSSPLSRLLLRRRRPVVTRLRMPQTRLPMAERTSLGTTVAELAKIWLGCAESHMRQLRSMDTPTTEGSPYTSLTIRTSPELMPHRRLTRDELLVWELPSSGSCRSMSS
mmetsp:Transcript_8804/g.24842  ORF Transcript_8804/g.24842 Transcript_8804/m.24842 type:complete len:282 (+) Transcript_8804:557-1402(+)